MARGHAASPPVYRPQEPDARSGVWSVASRGREIGYRGLLLLAFALPFDAEQRPLFWSNDLSITTLTVVLLALACVAATTIVGIARDALHGSRAATEYLYARRLPLALLAAYLLSAAISMVLAQRSTQGLTWLLDVVCGASLWLALPLWLAGDVERRVNGLAIALVAGAVVAATVGFVELALGPSFEGHLSPFKFGPSMMGPFLRLSATFSSANVAAMYLELGLAFAAGGAIGALLRSSGRWPAFIAWLVAIDVLLVALLLTYCRGALLGLLAAALAMALAGRSMWRSHARDWVRPGMLAAATLIAVVGVLAVSTSSIELLRLSTQNDRSWYRAGYASAVPATMKAGATRVIPVTVENRSPLTWGAHAYGLSYHWLHPSRAIVRFANRVSPLPADLRPSGRETVRATVVAPRAPGRYLLVWDMVWKGTTWFGPRTGSYQTSPVRVLPSRASPGPEAPPDIARLPTAPAMDRRRIWSVAVQMIERRPLFGTGPQGVRMNYVAYAPPGSVTGASKPPPHAHSLALELLADWGIVGAGLFAALFAALWWPLLRRVVSGRARSGWELAAIGMAAALLAHQVVDYFLTKGAIIIILWLVCGLAATMQCSRNNPVTIR